MQQSIDVNFDVTWKTPVYIWISNGVRELIDGPDMALAALLQRWPLTDSREFETAKRKCLAPITPHGSPELARDSFVCAALAVKVLT